MDPDAILVMTTLPDQASADHIAKLLVAERLAACVSTLSPCISTYRWQGGVETTSEIPLFIKATCQSYPKLEQRLRECHPYELPEIVAVPITGGLADYLQWIVRETDSYTDTPTQNANE